MSGGYHLFEIATVAAAVGGSFAYVMRRRAGRWMARWRRGGPIAARSAESGCTTCGGGCSDCAAPSAGKAIDDIRGEARAGRREHPVVWIGRAG